MTPWFSASSQISGDWWLVIGDWWLVIGDWWLVIHTKKSFYLFFGDWWFSWWFTFFGFSVSIINCKSPEKKVGSLLTLIISNCQSPKMFCLFFTFNSHLSIANFFYHLIKIFKKLLKKDQKKKCFLGGGEDFQPAPNGAGDWWLVIGDWWLTFTFCDQLLLGQIIFSLKKKKVAGVSWLSGPTNFFFAHYSPSTSFCWGRKYGIPINFCYSAIDYFLFCFD